MALTLLGAAFCGHTQTPSNDALLRLQKARIGVIQGSAHDTYAQKNLPHAQIFQFVSVSDLVLAVETGRVDAGINDEEGLRVLLKEKPDLRALGPSLFEARVGAGFRQDNNPLRLQFNAFVDHIKADGTWQDMVQRWTQQNRYDMPDIPLKADAPPLRVGNAIIGLPLVAIKEGKLTGFEVEMATRFAAHIGRRPVWNTVDWNALIPALASGKIEVIISSMYITPERELRIAFSTPYYQSGNFFFGLGQTAHAPKVSNHPSFVERTWSELKSSVQSNLIHEDRYLMLWDGLWVTVELSLWSALLGTLLGAGVCRCRMSPSKALSTLALAYIAVLRGTPVLVLLMIVFYVVFASVQASPVLIAVIAFSLNFSAYTAEIFRSGIQSIDRGQTEAGIAMGFNALQTFRLIVMPQTIQRVLPVYKGEFISMVKMTSIVGYVAVQDLAKASDIIRSRTFDAFFPLIMVAVLYFLIAWVMIQLLEWVERSTDPARRRTERA
jgi:polar amino acid transport system substrate-binding protein